MPPSRIQGQKGQIAGLLGRELDRPTKNQPVGGDHGQFLPAYSQQVEGIPFGFTVYREPDVTGRHPWWYQSFTKNYGDIDQPPVGVPMGPRHFSYKAQTSMAPGD